MELDFLFLRMVSPLQTVRNKILYKRKGLARCVILWMGRETMSGDVHQMSTSIANETAVNARYPFL
jgi:hypothetical protein